MQISNKEMMNGKTHSNTKVDKPIWDMGEVYSSKVKVEPGITVKPELPTGSFTDSNEDTAGEVDFIDGFKFVSYTSFENLAIDVHDVQQSESTSSCKKEETPRFTVDISDGRFQVNWRSLAADTENNNNPDNTRIKGRRNERYKGRHQIVTIVILSDDILFFILHKCR